MPPSPAFHAPRARKRTDLIAEEIKRWIVASGLKVGDRLPTEAGLAREFACAKGTIREALKSLEVQGVLRIVPGRNGGPVLVAASQERTAAQLKTFLHFRACGIEEVYRLRTLIEPAMAALVVGHLSAADFTRLEANLAACHGTAPEVRDRRRLRETELDFHVILAERCPDPLLAFLSRFLSDLLRDHIEFAAEEPARFDRFSRQTCTYHTRLLDALRREDREDVRRLMAAHVEAARRHTLRLRGTLGEGLMLER